MNIKGKIIDNNTKSPIPGVKVVFQNITIYTNVNGEFNLNIITPISVENNGHLFTINSFNEIQISEYYNKLSSSERQNIRSKLLISFYKKGYSQDNEIFPFNVGGEWLTDLGLIELISNKIQLDQDKILVQLPSNQENNLLKVKNLETNVKMGSSAQLQSSLNTLINQSKAILIPLILTMISEFGISLDIINSGKFENKKVCPDNSKLLEIINRRNKLVTQLNNLYKAVNVVSKTTTSLNGFLEILQITIQIAKNNPSPVPPTATSSLTELENKIKKYQYIISGISFISIVAATIIQQIIKLLSSLDILIRQCSINNNISLTEVNSDIIKISESINEDIYNKNMEYKGFTLEIQEDTQDNNKYVRRYAIARDVRGTIVLKGEPSFSSSTQILIDELKFQIDSQNLKAF